MTPYARRLTGIFLIALARALLIRRGDLDGAVSHLNEAYRLDPVRLSALVNLGGAAMNQGRAEESVGWYGKTLAVDPGLAFAPKNLVQALESLGRRDETQREARP